MSPQKWNSQTTPDQQATNLSPSNNGQLTSTALAIHNKANDTPAMVEAERIKRFVSDKDTYARSVTPNNEEGGKPNGKAHS